MLREEIWPTPAPIQEKLHGPVDALQNTTYFGSRASCSPSVTPGKRNEEEDRKKKRQAGRQKERKTGRQAGRKKERQAGRQVNRQTERQAGGRAGRQTDR